MDKIKLECINENYKNIEKPCYALSKQSMILLNDFLIQNGAHNILNNHIDEEKMIQLILT